MSLPTASVSVPSADGQAAPLYYTAGTNTTPKFRITWTYNCPDGHAQASAVIKVYADPAGGALHTHNHSGAAVTADLSGYAPANGTAYNITVNATCDGGLASGESSTSNRTCRPRWSRASYYYNMGATPPVGWGSPTINSTSDATSANVVEYSSSTSTSEPGTWYSSLAATPLPSGANNYVWHRVTQYAWGSASPTKPAVQDVTLRWSSVTLVADNWTTDARFVVDTATEKFGTQSIKGTPTGAGPFTINAKTGANNYVPVQPDTDYVLSYYVKSDGNTGAKVRVTETDLSTVIVEGTAETTEVDWRRHPLSAAEILKFNSGSRTAVGIVLSVGGTNGAQAWFDAIKLEASTVVTPWTPGFIGGGVAVDAGGLQVDASAGGVFRLRGSTGGARDIVELGTTGLKFGGSETLDSQASGILAASGDLEVKGSVLYLGGDTYIQRSAANEITIGIGDHLKTSTTSFVRSGHTAFPSSPSTEDLFYRKDLRTWFFYSGTAWRSVVLYKGLSVIGATAGATIPYTATTAAGNQRIAMPLFNGASNIWVEDAVSVFYVAGGGTALSGSHKWEVTGTLNPNSGTNKSFATIDSGSSSVWRSQTTTQSFLMANDFEIDLTYTKTGTPGNLYIHTEVTYRIQAT